MRESFHKELEALDQEIVRLGALVEQATQNATTALIESDRDLAHKVIKGDDEIDRVFLDIETRALMLMAQQAPVAGDLRLLVAILGVVNDLERAGDLANNIAVVALMGDFREPGLKDVRSLVFDLGDAASRLMAAAIDAWAAKDELLAAAIDDRDDELDDLDAQLLETLVELKGQESLGPALRLALVGRYLERIGDHAVNLAERVRYFVTGDEEYLG
jgi:phosphate transport system protein